MFLKIVLYIYLIILALFDLFKNKIPNVLVFSLFITCFSVFISTDFYNISTRFISANIISIICLIISYFTKGLGGGDIKLIFVLSFMSGFFKSIIVLLTASLLGLLFFGLVKLNKKKISKLPFAPFISAGVFVTDVLWKVILK